MAHQKGSLCCIPPLFFFFFSPIELEVGDGRCPFKVSVVRHGWVPLVWPFGVDASPILDMVEAEKTGTRDGGKEH